MLKFVALFNRFYKTYYKFPEPTTIPVEKIMMVLLHRPAVLKASVKFLTDSSITDTIPIG